MFCYEDVILLREIQRESKSFIRHQPEPKPEFSVCWLLRFCPQLQFLSLSRLQWLEKLSKTLDSSLQFTWELDITRLPTRNLSGLRWSALASLLLLFFARSSFNLFIFYRLSDLCLPNVFLEIKSKFWSLRGKWKLISKCVVDVFVFLS